MRAALQTESPGVGFAFAVRTTDLRGVGGALLVCMMTVLGCGGDTPREDLGRVGSPIWFDTSTDLVVTDNWSYEMLGPNDPPGSSGSTTQSWARAVLSQAQLAGLAALRLIPLDGRCLSDGYDYREVTVVDEDGSRAAYRDTGCSYLAAVGATAMLSPGALSAALSPP
jgi:hypothetical protein